MLSRILFGSRDVAKRRTFTGITTGVLVAVIFLVPVFVQGRWFQTGGVAVSAVLLFVVGVVGGVRKYGFIYTFLPGYIFSLWLYHRLLPYTEPVLKPVLIRMMIVLVLSVPPVVVGYVLGERIERMTGSKE